MKNSSIRSLAAWLCTLLLIPTLASCAEKDAGNPVSQTVSTEAATTAPPLSPEDINANALKDAVKNLPEKDYGGEAFTILCRGDSWATLDVFAEKETGDAINDAVFQRNRLLEENFNIHVVSVPVAEPYQDARKQISAGESAFDILTDGLNPLGNLVPSGYLLDLNTIPGLELSNPWWDQEMNTDLTIQNKLFFATGDISIMDNEGTWCTMFNKDIALNNDLDDLYTLVREGKWTLDVMHSMAKAVTKDLDGNGTVDPEDQWGLLTEDFNQYGLWAASGETIIKKDKNDLPVLSAYNDRSVSAMEAVKNLQLDKSCTLSANSVPTGCDFTNEAFGNGRALFIYGGMWLVTHYRGYDINFGIIPSPKYDETQERYYNTYSYWNCTAYSIPTTCPNIEKTGILTEAMAELSRYTLTPAYYDISLKGKFIRDEESADMIDIILSQRAYDLGNIFNWGNMFTTITGLSSNPKGDFASAYAKREKSAQKAIDKFVDTLSQME